MTRFFSLSRDSLRFYLASVEAHFASIPDWGKLLGLLVGFGNLIVGDILTPVLCLIAVASGIDWFYGRLAAMKEDRYEKTVSTIGWRIKAGVILVIMLVRGFEAWLTTFDNPWVAGFQPLLATHGFVSTALAVGVFVDELDSIDENLRALGYKGIPGLTRVLHLMRSFQNKLLDVDQPRRRATDA